MEIKLDFKTLIVGIILGMILAFALAFNGSADQADFGIAIQEKGSALVQTTGGDFWIVDSDNGMATRVLIQPSLSDDPDTSRSSRDTVPLNFNLGRRGTED